MFASLFIENEPLGVKDLPAGLILWVQVAGGFALFALLLWLILGLPRMRAADRARLPRWLVGLFAVATATAFATYAVYLALLVWAVLNPTPPGGKLDVARFLFRTASGLCALVGVGLLFGRSLFTASPRRVWALTRLSFKEAVRRRVLYGFSALLLVFLFASWFIQTKPEDQVRTYVQVVFTAMTLLLLPAAGILAAFSIPADIRQQTIHTILTKPVERLEVVLGRFFGFLGLMTLVLLFMSGLSLAYILRGVHPDAAAESLKARVPLYGSLAFENTTNRERGDNVGREWDYRSYITAPTGQQAPGIAVWDFASLPSALADRKEVPCEFGFDIYRTTKGQENRGIACLFAFRTANYVRGNDELYRRDRTKLEQEGGRAAAIADQLAEEYGYYEITTEVTDYHTQTIKLPGGLFRNALRKARPADAPPAPALQVRVRCASATQYVGMAKHDLYLRADDPSAGSEQMLFAWNFFKAAFGLWLQLGLVIGVAVALSTYLSGVISLLVTGFLYFCGTAREFVYHVATGQNVGGGPVESLYRLARREIAPTPIEEGTVARVAGVSDSAFRWMVQRVFEVIPDVGRFDLTSYVAEGFDISGVQLLLNFLLLVAYLLPWVVLAYYLIRWREVASSN